MAFKMNYNFEGKPRNLPEQNMAGASKKMTRDALLQKTHEERRKRQEQRLKLQSAEFLQSHMRSYLVRQQKKNEERQLFDRGTDTLSIKDKLRKLLFFYYYKIDQERLITVTNEILLQQNEVLNSIESNIDYVWLIKRYLVICLKNINNKSLISNQLQALNVFSNNPDTLLFLIRKGFYAYLRTLLDNTAPENNGLLQIMHLINRPFKFQCEHTVLSEFCSSFLKPPITYNVKFHLIPFLKQEKCLPYKKIVRHLNNGYHFENTNSLFYSLLILEPDNSTPTFDSVKVFSLLSKDIYRVHLPKDLIRMNDYDNEDSENDEETMDMPLEEQLMSDYVRIMNNTDKVRKLLVYFDANCDKNDELLGAFTNFCHNLLLVHKESIRKFLLLYKLGLHSKFINRLWSNINSKQYNELELKSSLNTWKENHRFLSVFCDMFTFYTETLTDGEKSDTSDTFAPQDLFAMSKLLKNLAIDLIEAAFPMCRSSTVTANTEILHLYRACLNCVKKLHMLDMRKQFCHAGFWTAKKIHVSPDLSRKNYLSMKIVPFHGVVYPFDEEEHLPPLSTIEQRSLAILQELPFLIAFNTRFLLLRDLCRYSLGENDYQRMHHELLNDGVVVIRRTHLYEDSFEKISTKSETDLKHRLRIQFINNVGLEEAGIDGGGIFKEFINEVLKTAFDPNRGFFLMTADNTLYPNPNVHLIVDNFMEHYNFIGKLVGKAIFENILVDLPLAEFFLAKLLVDKASAHYLKSLDPVLYRNLLYLRDYSEDVSDLGLDFTTVNNDLGETRVVELIPNGSNIQVANDNRLEYIQKLADLKLNTQLKRQCEAFREGLNTVVPLLWLTLFSHNELQIIIGGDTQEIDFSDLRAHTVYGGEFTADHPTIILFWKILNKFTGIQKKQLLKFVTSCSRPPLLGFKELNPQFCIQSSGTEIRMPTASTCLNLLKIPIFNEEEVLRSKLLSAIEQQAGFELS